MGYGDWLMAAGEARELHARTRLPVIVVGRDGRPQWSEVFDHNPYIKPWKSRHEPHTKMVNGGGWRPYIAGKTPTKWVWKPYKPKPAQVFLTGEEFKFTDPYRGYVLVEPNGKDIGHTNKLWSWERWNEVIYACPDIPFLQCLNGGSKPLSPLNVRHVVTPTFRHAMAIVSRSEAFVGTEGGLMHAAAAFNIPSVILWSEFISPEITGYAYMHNLRHAGKPCGSRVDCAGCRASMDAISADEVVTTLRGILE